jgi:hypothetical protein
MNIQLHKIAFTTTIALAAVVNNIGIVFADPLPTVRSNPNIQVKLNPTTISGDVTITFGHYASKGNLQCKDLSVALNSVETLPSQPSGGFQQPGKSIFSESRKLSGDLSTGKCHYGVATAAKYIGKKATVTFFGGGDGGSNETNVTIPNQPLQKNMQATFTRIG